MHSPGSPIVRHNSHRRLTLVLFCNAHKLAASEHERTAVGGRARHLLHPHVRLVCWPRVIRFRAHVREQQRGRRGAGTNAHSMTSCVHATPVPKSDQRPKPLPSKFLIAPLQPHFLITTLLVIYSIIAAMN